MFKRRGRFARRKLGQALVPAGPSGLPSIFLGEMPRPERKLPPVYLCETDPDGASCRLKWMASTCLAGLVGVCLIGVAIYASLNMGDGSGMVSSIKRASLAALQPIRTATLAKLGQSAGGQKEDRIQMTAGDAFVSPSRLVRAMRPLVVRVGSATGLLPRLASRLVTRKKPLPLTVLGPSKPA